MIEWIESQSIPVIALIVFVLWYLLAAIIYGIVMHLSRRPVADELKTVSPVTLTPLAVILGLLIAFLASRVWENVGHANDYIGQEAGALARVAAVSQVLPEDIRVKVRTAIRHHIEFLEKQEWPAMAHSHLELHRESPALSKAMSELIAFTASQANEQYAQQRAIEAMEDAFEARRNRLRISRAEIAPIQWYVIFLLAMLILITTGLVHTGRPVAMAVTMFIFASAVSASLVLLLVNDRPLASGGITISPTAFRGIVVE
jgi:hypothetical protein